VINIHNPVDEQEVNDFVANNNCYEVIKIMDEYDYLCGKNGLDGLDELDGSDELDELDDVIVKNKCQNSAKAQDNEYLVGLDTFFVFILYIVYISNISMI
jgi:hypothetical protein